jgi:hypothetical protein
MPPLHLALHAGLIVVLREHAEALALAASYGATASPDATTARRRLGLARRNVWAMRYLACEAGCELHAKA